MIRKAITTRATLIMIATWALLNGALLLLLKTPVLLPLLTWLRTVPVTELDTYLSLIALGWIAVGAAILCAAAILAHLARRTSQEPKHDTVE